MRRGQVSVMKARTAIILMIGLLALASLACEQAGEILTPAEATARAEEAFQLNVSPGSSVAGSEFQIGDTVTLIGRSFLVNLYDAPGGKIAAGQERGTAVTILESALYNEETWYKIKAPTGEGWVAADNLEPAEEAEASGPQPGEEVYLAGKSYLVNFMDQPGGKMVAGQERGVTVTILEIAQFEGDTWYKISAPTGEGWVPSENITTEAP
jgi:hypothetical protein